jgi:hypothetical protein
MNQQTIAIAFHRALSSGVNDNVTHQQRPIRGTIHAVEKKGPIMSTREAARVTTVAQAKAELQRWFYSVTDLGATFRVETRGSNFEADEPGLIAYANVVRDSMKGDQS